MTYLLTDARQLTVAGIAFVAEASTDGLVHGNAAVIVRAVIVLAGMFGVWRAPNVPAGTK